MWVRSTYSPYPAAGDPLIASISANVNERVRMRQLIRPNCSRIRMPVGRVALCHTQLGAIFVVKSALACRRWCLDAQFLSDDREKRRSKRNNRLSRSWTARRFHALRVWYFKNSLCSCVEFKSCVYCRVLRLTKQWRRTLIKWTVQTYEEISSGRDIFFQNREMR